MHDDVDRPADRSVVQDSIPGDVPVVRDIGHILVADDDQQVEIRLIAFSGSSTRRQPTATKPHSRERPAVVAACARAWGPAAAARACHAESQGARTLAASQKAPEHAPLIPRSA
jgi:hypothetical protein